mmetsp:Transcript_12983/g.19782  ORF Transcript_12983/g.19782 Transcript_12983/m.19782 type:complete len:297 (-) Transcript_12983:65-955(-)|eukprot:CAMPEP_0196807588 /NCGR_PEP_ID=MMETSP1362-20130617/7584_1 /TAXON_ID=163516 /ORGANISM="Leptocylindrus danicus, Strain CCMP1856" /LENGTH=296 /DNA_ID=CAMNT_0042181577 /DNA_START=148 /DNA_END=1038 /DNA_ORIENTATION=-
MSLPADQPKEESICFQDLKIGNNTDVTYNDSNDKESVTKVCSAEALFEMANSSCVSYRICGHPNRTIVVRQDRDCQDHTGGIVWETAYLLASFLEQKFGSKDQKSSKCALGQTLEVGAGCGLLGLVLSAAELSNRVVMTEATEAMHNLKSNVKDVRRKFRETNAIEMNVIAQQLRWDNCKLDIKNGGDALSGEFDTIVGTDVVFRKDLVKPLLKTLHTFSHSNTKVYLCLQERCVDAHSELMQKAPRYFKVEDQTQELRNTKGCVWGVQDLECKLIMLSSPRDRKKSSRKRKRAKH